MKKNSLQSYKVQYRLKTELKTMNQIPISPLRMSSLVVVHCIKFLVLISLAPNFINSSFPTLLFMFCLSTSTA